MAQRHVLAGMLLTCLLLALFQGVHGEVYFTQVSYRVTIPATWPVGKGILRMLVLEDRPDFRHAGHVPNCWLGAAQSGDMLTSGAFIINSTSHWISLKTPLDPETNYPRDFHLSVWCGIPREGATSKPQRASVTVTVSADSRQGEPCAEQCFGGVDGVDRLEVAELSGPVVLARLKPWTSQSTCNTTYSITIKPSFASQPKPAFAGLFGPPIKSRVSKDFIVDNISGDLRLLSSQHHIVNAMGSQGYLALSVRCSPAEGATVTKHLKLHVRDLNNHRPHATVRGRSNKLRLITKEISRTSHISQGDPSIRVVFSDKDFPASNKYTVCLYNDTWRLFNITNVTFVYTIMSSRISHFQIEIAYIRDIELPLPQYTVDVVVTDTTMVHIKGSNETRDHQDNQLIYRLILNITNYNKTTRNNAHVKDLPGSAESGEIYRPCWCGGNATCPIKDSGFTSNKAGKPRPEGATKTSRANQTYSHQKSAQGLDRRQVVPQNVPVLSPARDVCGQSCRIMLALTLAVITVLCIVAFMAWRVRRRRRKSRDVKHVGSLVSLSAIPSDYVDERSRRVSASSVDWSPRCIGSKLPADSKWEFPRKSLVLDKCLGEGEFGRVVRAKAFNIRGHEGYSTVAVKMLKPCASGAEFRDLLSEYSLLKDVSHTNVIKLLGACSQKGPFYLIVEYCKHGSLRSYLRRCRQGEPPYVDSRDTGLGDSIPDTDMDTEAHITCNDLLSFCWQIAKGMEYLSLMKVVHRDLAARNVLVATNKVIKISDFGLSRDVYEEDTYLKTSKGRIPVKWMAPESLYEHTYTTKSDVWSFGVVLWEIVTLGATPYPGLVPEHLYHLLKSGYRMEKPNNCSDCLYGVMSHCWESLPTSRPTFKQLGETFESMLQSSVEYLDLSAALQERHAMADDDSGDPNDERQDKLEVDGYNSDLEEGYGSISRLSTDDRSYLTYTPASHADDDDQQVTYSQVITCDDCTLRMLQANQGADHATENTLLLARAAAGCIKFPDQPGVDAKVPDDVSDDEGLRLVDENEANGPERVIIV